MIYYGLFGKFTAVNGKRDQLADILLEAADLLQTNADCIQYIVSTSDDTDSVWVSEAWTSKTAHDASLAPADIKALIQKAMPLIADMSDQTGLRILGGKGI